MINPNINLRYISRNRNGTYTIKKTIDGKQRYYGTYDTLSKAIDKRNYFEEHDWDKSLLKLYDSARRKTHKYTLGNNPHSSKPDYCIVNMGKYGYEIRHHNPRTRKLDYFGRYPTLKIARQERDLLIQADWDIDAWCDTN